ncbi:MAG: electron transport complex subunit E [Eubacteriales bacterium]|nr:electron transport complex subunit E [Eubacteriales bacterium]
MKNNKYLERIYNGVWKENPLFVLLLGTCPTLAVTTSATNGLGMGLAATAVLVFSNIIISALRNIIPDKVRLPAEIVIVASLVTVCDMLMEAFVPDLYESLGIFIPLIVVNCIILGRAESYALKHNPILSMFDGLGMGLGFAIALVLIGGFREILGAGTIFGFRIMPQGYTPISIFILAPGAFLVYAMLTALQNKLKLPCATNGDAIDPDHVMCDGNCTMCRMGAGSYKTEKKEEA